MGTGLIEQKFCPDCKCYIDHAYLHDVKGKEDKQSIWKCNKCGLENIYNDNGDPVKHAERNAVHEKMLEERTAKLKPLGITNSTSPEPAIAEVVYTTPPPYMSQADDISTHSNLPPIDPAEAEKLSPFKLLEKAINANPPPMNKEHLEKCLAEMKVTKCIDCRNRQVHADGCFCIAKKEMMRGELPFTGKPGEGTCEYYKHGSDSAITRDEKDRGKCEKCGFNSWQVHYEEGFAVYMCRSCGFEESKRCPDLYLAGTMQLCRHTSTSCNGTRIANQCPRKHDPELKKQKPQEKPIKATRSKRVPKQIPVPPTKKQTILF